VTVIWETATKVSVTPGPPLATHTQSIPQDSFLDSLAIESKEALLEAINSATSMPILFGSISVAPHANGYAFGWALYTNKKVGTYSGLLTGRYNIDNATVQLTGLLGLLSNLPTAHGTTSIELQLHLSSKEVVRSLLNKSPVGIKQAITDTSNLLLDIKKCQKSLGSIYTVYYKDVITDESPKQLQQALADAASLIADSEEDPLQLKEVQGVLQSCSTYIERDGKPLVGLSKKVVIEELYEEQLRGTIQKAERWNQATYNKVDWGAYEKVFAKLSRARQVTYAKKSHRLVQTNARNYRFYGTDSSCPCCGNQEETLSHIFICPTVEVAVNRGEL
jgi:hypothetical protein